MGVDRGISDLYGDPVKILAIVFGVLGVSLIVFGMMAFTVTWIVNQIDTFSRRQMAVMNSAIEKQAELITTTTVTSIEKVVGVILGESLGKKGEAVRQAEVPASEDPNNPEWTKWGDGPENEWEMGAGDSVWFERPGTSDVRTAAINEGEAIIPGVPLPDMTGENYRG